MFGDQFFKLHPYERFISMLAENVDLTDAKLLDDHTFKVNGITYNQKVYRLKTNYIYTENKVVKEDTIESLTEEMHKAASNEDYERAAYLRNQIKRLEKSSA